MIRRTTVRLLPDFVQHMTFIGPSACFELPRVLEAPAPAVSSSRPAGRAGLPLEDDAERHVRLGRPVKVRAAGHEQAQFRAARARKRAVCAGAVLRVIRLDAVQARLVRQRLDPPGQRFIVQWHQPGMRHDGDAARRVDHTQWRRQGSRTSLGRYKGLPVDRIAIKRLFDGADHALFDEGLREVRPGNDLGVLAQPRRARRPSSPAGRVRPSSPPSACYAAPGSRAGRLRVVVE